LLVSTGDNVSYTKSIKSAKAFFFVTGIPGSVSENVITFVVGDLGNASVEERNAFEVPSSTLVNIYG